MARDTVTPSHDETETGNVFTRESTRRFVLLSLEVLFLLIIVVALDALWSRTNFRYDLTPEHKYSLAEVTTQAFRALSQPVQATVFYRRGDREKHEELLRLLSEQSQNFTYQLFDLDRAPGVAQRYGVTGYGAGVIETAKNRVSIPVTDEERVLNGLLRVTQDEKHIYFLVGHSENDAADSDERNGYGVVRRVLETENYRVHPLPLRQLGVVPKNADLVIASGPKDDFTPEELEILSTYFAAGGNAILLLDPYTVPSFARYLERFGFALSDDVVVDSQTQMAGGDPLTPVIGKFSREVFPRDPRGEPIMPVVRPVHTAGGKAQAFAYSSETSWAIRDRARVEQGELTFKDGEDQRGPLPVAAVATTGTEKQGKLVVLGDSEFVNNFYARIPGNVDFFMNTVGWLLGRQELIALGRVAHVSETKRNTTPQQALYLTHRHRRTSARTHCGVGRVLPPEAKRMSWSQESRRVVVFGLLACVLGGYAYVTAPTKKPLNTQGELKTERPVFTFNAEQVQRFAVAYDGKHIIGERTSEGWKSPEGVRFPSLAIDDFLLNLTKVVNLGEVEQGRDDKLTDYGLQPPVSQITVNVAGEDKQSLAIGKHNPVNTSLYALVNQRPQIILVGSIISWELRKLMDAVNAATAG
jgi:hypothetical protein